MTLETDVLTRLKRWGALKKGDSFPPDLVPDPWDWGPPLSALFHDAIEEIERLRSALEISEEASRRTLGILAWTDPEMAREIERLRTALRTALKWMNDGHELREPSLTELREAKETVCRALGDGG